MCMVIVLPKDEIVVVNDWSFCRVHGSESCDTCSADYRPLNDVQFLRQATLDDLFLDMEVGFFL